MFLSARSTRRHEPRPRRSESTAGRTPPDLPLFSRRPHALARDHTKKPRNPLDTLTHPPGLPRARAECRHSTETAPALPPHKKAPSASRPRGGNPCRDNHIKKQSKAGEPSVTPGAITPGNRDGPRLPPRHRRLVQRPPDTLQTAAGSRRVAAAAVGAARTLLAAAALLAAATLVAAHARARIAARARAARAARAPLLAAAAAAAAAGTAEPSRAADRRERKSGRRHKSQNRKHGKPPSGVVGWCELNANITGRPAARSRDVNSAAASRRPARALAHAPPQIVQQHSRARTSPLAPSVTRAPSTSHGSDRTRSAVPPSSGYDPPRPPLSTARSTSEGPSLPLGGTGRSVPPRCGQGTHRHSPSPHAPAHLTPHSHPHSPPHSPAHSPAHSTPQARSQAPPQAPGVSSSAEPPRPPHEKATQQHSPAPSQAIATPAHPRHTSAHAQPNGNTWASSSRTIASQRHMRATVFTRRSTALAPTRPPSSPSSPSSPFLPVPTPFSLLLPPPAYLTHPSSHTIPEGINAADPDSTIAATGYAQ